MSLPSSSVGKGLTISSIMVWTVYASLQHFDCLLGTGIDTCPALLTEAQNRIGHIIWPFLLPEPGRTFKNGGTDSLLTFLRVAFYIIHRDFQFWLQHVSFLAIVMPPLGIGSHLLCSQEVTCLCYAHGSNSPNIAQQPLSLLPNPWIGIGAGSGRFARASEVDIGWNPSSKRLKTTRGRSTSVFLGWGDEISFQDAVFWAVLFVAGLGGVTAI